MIEIFQAQTQQDIERANALTLEYLEWCVQESRSVLNEELDIDELAEHSIADQEYFLVESGRLLLARDKGRITGIACLKKLRENVCEIKRLYVQPVSRGMGLGKLLLEKLIEHAKDCGYTRIFLDSDPYMKNAHAMYRSLGFVEIPPYPEAEMAGNDYAQHMVFMELVLGTGKG